MSCQRGRERAKETEKGGRENERDNSGNIEVHPDSSDPGGIVTLLET